MEIKLYKQMAEVEDEHWWFLARRYIIRSLIKKYAKEVDSCSAILDAGCGTGGNLRYFSTFSKNIKGMEMNTLAREFACKSSGTEVVYGKFPDEIPFINEQFDLILMLDVLEHLDDDVLALKNISEKIKKDKYLVVTVPAFDFLWSGHDDIHHHKRRYLLRDLEKRTIESGFKPVYSSYFNFFLFPLIAAVRLVKNKDYDNLKLPDKILNKILYYIMSFEAVLLKILRFPFGVSIIMILKRQS